MRLAASVAAALIAAACAAPRPGPTENGMALRVTARDKAAARREAVADLLPLFVDERAREARAAEIEAAVLSRAERFVGRESHPKGKDGVVEVRVDVLSGALQSAGLVRPRGYAAGAQAGLIAFGDRGTGPDAAERLAADAFETALFGRGLQARDADDPLLPLAHPLRGKTEREAAAETAADGWSWLAAGRVAGGASPQNGGAWRGTARLAMSVYGVEASTEPARISAEGEAVDVSSAAAVSRAIEQSAQTAAIRLDQLLSRRRAGRRTLAVMVSGRLDKDFLLRMARSLRAIPGVEGAALTAWGVEGALAVMQVYAAGVTPDALAARLIGVDPPFRVIGVETEDGRLTVEAEAAADSPGEAF